MSKLYKPSMFNYICENNNGLILYNSFVGTNSIISVSSKQKEKVNNFLKCRQVTESDLVGKERLLIKKGFLVDFYENEKVKRDFLFSQVVNDSTLFLVITVTEKCNFSCKYCSLDFNKERMSEVVQENIVQFVRKNISNYSGMRVEWFGGEPLLCVDIIEKLSKQFINICRKSHKWYTASITTNGYLLDLKTFKILFENKVVAYQVTLDGLKDDHDKQRCLTNYKGTFDKILSNLIDIKSNVISKFFKINIRTNFTKGIAEKIEDYLNFYESKFSGDSRFAFFARIAEDWGGERVKTFEGLLNKRQEKNLLDKICNCESCLNFFMNFTFLEPGKTVCHAVYKNMFNIGCDGKIYKCDSSIEIACVGKLKNGGELSIDQYKLAQWSYGTRYLAPECDECFFSCSCIKGGCPLDVIRGHDPLKKRCSFERDNIDSILKLFVKSINTEEI